MSILIIYFLTKLSLHVLFGTLNRHQQKWQKFSVGWWTHEPQTSLWGYKFWSNQEVNCSLSNISCCHRLLCWCLTTGECKALGLDFLLRDVLLCLSACNLFILLLPNRISDRAVRTDNSIWPGCLNTLDPGAGLVVTRGWQLAPVALWDTDGRGQLAGLARGASSDWWSDPSVTGSWAVINRLSFLQAGGKAPEPGWLQEQSLSVCYPTSQNLIKPLLFTHKHGYFLHIRGTGHHSRQLLKSHSLFSLPEKKSAFFMDKRVVKHFVQAI